jgi:hypothetical protein
MSEWLDIDGFDLKLHRNRKGIRRRGVGYQQEPWPTGFYNHREILEIQS